MKKTILVYILISAAGAAFAQKILHETYYTINGYNSGSEIPVADLQSAKEFDTTAVSKDLKIYMVELTATMSKKTVTLGMMGQYFPKSLKEKLQKVKPGDKLFFDIKVKDKAGKIFTLPTHYFKVKE